MCASVSPVSNDSGSVEAVSTKSSRDTKFSDPKRELITSAVLL